jgi:hypothetical protein
MRINCTIIDLITPHELEALRYLNDINGKIGPHNILLTESAKIFMEDFL